MMKKNWCCGESMTAFGLLALRIAVGIVFISAGWMKLQGIGMVTGMFETMGFPIAGFFAWLVAIVEFVGGIAVVLGVYTKEVAKFLAIIMIVALLTAHRSGPLQAAVPAISMLGATLALAGVGAGKWRLVKNESCCMKGTDKGGCCGGAGSCECKKEGKK